VPIIQYSGGTLDSRFNSAVTRLRDKWAEHGFKMYENTLLDEIAMVDMSSRKAIEQIGMLIDGSRYEITGLTSEAHYSENPPKVIAECPYKRMDLFGIEWGKLQDDLSREVAIRSIPDLAGKPVQAPLLEILSLLNSNPACLYDGKTFFNTQHLIDPLSADVTDNQASNLITQALSSTGWNTVLQTIMQRKDPGSDTSNGKNYLPNRSLTGQNLIIWTGYTSHFTDLQKIFDPKNLWAAANGPEYRRVYTQASVQLVPEMAAYSGSDNYVYLLVNNTPNRGVFARIPHSPTIDRSQPGSDVEVDRKVQRVHAYQTFGKTTCFPWALYKWQFS